MEEHHGTNMCVLSHHIPHCYHVIYTFGRTSFHIYIYVYMYIYICIYIYVFVAVMLQLLDPPSTAHTRLRRIVHLAPPPKKAAAVSSITYHGGWKMSRDVGKIWKNPARFIANCHDLNQLSVQNIIRIRFGMTFRPCVIVQCASTIGWIWNMKPIT